MILSKTLTATIIAGALAVASSAQADAIRNCKDISAQELNQGSGAYHITTRNIRCAPARPVIVRAATRQAARAA